MQTNGIGIRNRVLVIAVGAGTVVLALIAFSGICWGTLSAVGGWLSAWTFWEFFALWIAIAAVALMMRPLGRRLQWRRTDPGTSPNAAGNLAPAGVESSECRRQRASWREMYDQLSDDERAEFKALMQKYCGCGGESTMNAGAAAGSGRGTPRRESGS